MIFLRRQPHHAAELVVHIEVAAIAQRGDRNRIITVLENGLELLLVLAKFLLGEFFLGDIAENPRVSYQLPRTIADRGHQKQSIEFHPVLAAQPRCHTNRFFTAFQTSARARDFFAVARRHQITPMPSDHFIGGISQQFRRGGIPSDDGPVDGSGNDSLAARFDDRSRQRQVILWRPGQSPQACVFTAASTTRVCLNFPHDVRRLKADAR